MRQIDETEPELFIDEQNPTSRRFAVLEDDGESCWLYLTLPESTEIVGTAWVYNRIQPLTAKEVRQYVDQPPPVGIGYAGADAVRTPPQADDVQFAWSEDGNSVAVIVHSELYAFIVDGESRGYSRFLLRPGPWGNLLDTALFKRIFHY